MVKADYHVHTEFSGDSEEKIANIVKKAVDMGLDEICITDHQDFDFIAEDILYELDVNKYYETIQDYAEEYRNLITIKIGVETGLEPDKADRLNTFVNSRNFDFVIGSSHLINGYDPYYPEYFENKTDEKAFIEYFESILKNLEVCHNFDVYGHLDYVVRYSPNKDNNFSYNAFKEILDEILKKIISLDKGIEINTSGLRSGLKFPNPCPDIIKRYKELGGKIITVGSDAHYSKHVGYEFKLAGEILKSCGFNYYNVFKNRIPEYKKI